MALNKFKDKIKTLASGESLGETKTVMQEDSLEGSEIKRKKTGPIKNEGKRKTSTFNPLSRKKATNKMEDLSEIISNDTIEKELNKETSRQDDSTRKSSEINVVENAIEGYKDVLDIANVKEKLDLEVQIKSSDIDYISFTQTTPYGFHYEEVTDFLSLSKYTIHQLEKALLQRDRDVIILASEAKKIENRMVQQTQDAEMERMVGGQTEEERLIEENIDLKIRITNLEKRLQVFSENKESLEDITQELQALRSENEYLRKSLSETPGPGIVNIPAGLPKIEDEVSLPEIKDSFDSMLDGIGELYEEE